MINLSCRFSALLPAAALALAAPVAASDSQPLAPPSPTYADIADLADTTALVIRVQPRKVAAIEAARARGLHPGWTRLYVEARTEALIAGAAAVGAKLVYLVDMPVDPKGKVPAIRKKSMVVFARPVAGRPGEVQLVARDAQLPWDAPLDGRIRSLLKELYAPAAAQRITGVREVLHVPGNLADAGETQIFLTTGNGAPAAITVGRVPGREPNIAVSFSEVMSTDAGVPARDTLAWYRLACFLPGELPPGANIAGSPEDRAAAAADYHAVLERLGPCPRNRS